VSIKDIRDKKIIKKISFLKKQYWNYSIKELNDWFRKNIDKKDIHNMILCSNKLVGYTCLRLGSYKLENKKNKIYYFDTLIIDKNYRKNNFGGIIMNFNNYIIKKSLTPSFLICEKLMIKFYDKYGWKNKIKKFSIINHDPRKKSVMYFNFKNENKISNKEIIFKI
jgi:hypothetical protein